MTGQWKLGGGRRMSWGRRSQELKHDNVCGRKQELGLWGELVGREGEQTQGAGLEGRDWAVLTFTELMAKC